MSSRPKQVNSAALSHSVSAVLALAATVALVPVAGAQQLLDEVFVTAQKRSESMQDVPVSVTAFSAEAIRSLSVTNSTDLAAHTPNLSIGTPVGEGNNPSVVLRGIGLNDFNDNNESNVALYIDDVYRAALAGQTFQLFDLERVEVLRGPQGTLYGRNTTGGLIHFISRRPTSELEAYGDLTFGPYGQKKAEGAISGGSERVMGRLSFAMNDHDGYVKNRIGRDPNEASSVAWRAQLLLEPSDSFSALFNVHGADADPRAAAYQHEGTAGGGVDFFGYEDTDGDVFAGEYDRVGVLDIESFGASGTFNWQLPSGTALTWIFATEDVDKLHEEDTDMQGNPWANPTFQAESEQMTSELRLAGTHATGNWLAGVYWIGYDVDSTQTQLDLSGLGAPIVDVEYHQQARSWAAFGQFDRSLSDRWELQLGLRYTRETKDYSYIQSESFFGIGEVYNFSSATAGSLTRMDTSNFSGRLALNFKPNDDMLVFGSLARGFKSGGFNAGFICNVAALGCPEDLPLDKVPFSEEQLTALELGFKSTLLDGRMRLNGTVFYYDYQDLQALTFSGVSQFIGNASDAQVSGAEFELQAQITDRLGMQFGVGLLDATADGVSAPPAGGLLRNRKLVLAPDVSIDGVLTYDVPIGSSDNDLRLQIDFTHRGKHYFDIVNQPVSEQKAYTVFNARASYRFNDNFEVAVFGKNLFEEEYKVYTFDFSGSFGFNQQFYGPPRWWGVQFRFEY